MNDRTCSVEGCVRVVRCKGLCNVHYQRMRKGKPLDAPIQARSTYQATVCRVDGCSNASVARGWCAMHYYRVRTYGDPGPAEKIRQGGRTCGIEGCDRPYDGNGLCAMHRMRVKATGDVGSAEPQRAPNGTWAGAMCSVPKCDRGANALGMCQSHYARYKKGERGEKLARPFKKMNQERIIKNGYAFVRLPEDSLVTPALVAPSGTRYVQEHRLVMASVIGRDLYPWENVHHVNGIRDDNRPENLELWVKPQPNGQRPSDLAEWVVEYYPELVEAALAGRRQLRLAT